MKSIEQVIGTERRRDKESLLLLSFLLLTFLLFLCVFPFFIENLYAEWSPADNLYQGNIICSSARCVSIEEATHSAVTKGYVKKQNLELVFQAKQRILKSLGQLIPRFEVNFGIGLYPTSFLNTVSNLLGVIIPSNWFNWQESKLFYAAQKSIYLGILRNLITDTEVLYYNIHRVAQSMRIYEFYAENLQKLIDDIKARRAREALEPRSECEGKITIEDVLILENMLGDIRIEAAFLNTVISNWYSYDLAVAMAYPDLEEIGIRPIELPNLSTLTPHPVLESELKQIQEKSTENLTIRYLIRASAYSRLSRVFSFLNAGNGDREPGPGISFGLDNIADIRIASSEKKYLEIQLKESQAKIESAYRRLIDISNGSLDLFRKYQAAKESNRTLLFTLLERYRTEGTFDAGNLTSAIEWALKFDLNRNYIEHLYLITQSQIDRLLVRGKKYEELPEYVPASIELDRWRNGQKVKENWAIERDIQKGKLDLTNP